MATVNKFAQALKVEDANQSVSMTEKGALGYEKTKSRLVDFFFKVGSMRSMTEEDITANFAEAYAEDPRRALELLFFIRDCRGGMGEKRVFKVCFDWLVRNYPGDACDLIKLIPEYGSWKAFVELTDSFRKDKRVEELAQGTLKSQWLDDTSKDGHVSLLGKWMPSENTSSKDTCRLGTYWRKVLGMNSKSYRKALVKLRKTIRVVETDMTAGNWSEIDYNGVPAKAGMIYKNAFLKHDEARRRKWLEALVNGDPKAKINTSGLTIPEMVAKYMAGCSGWSGDHVAAQDDPVIEAAWRDLVAKAKLPENAVSMIPVIDGSGSMYSHLQGNSSVQAIHVSIGLGLFLANINTEAWRGMCIEFGENPCFFQVPTGASLREQIKIAVKHDDCGNTNVKKVFDLILDTAVKNGMTQKDIPQIVTFSDMEFDAAYPACSWYDRNQMSQERLFETIAKEYNRAGFLLPKMVFWNINSRTGTIPMTENELGVALLSGFNQSIMDMVLTRKLDPLAVLLERLDSPRYDLVRKALA